MSKKMIWGLAIFLILIITATVWKVLHDRAYIKQLEYDLAGKQEIKEERDKPPEQVNKKDLDTSHPDFHVHEDGTPHIGTHEEPKEQYTAPEGAVLKPDFPKVDPTDDPVKAAYKRLEYIKNNPYAWGGVHSLRATELIAELMPAFVPNDHSHGELVIVQIAELCEQGDPRAAEVLIAHMCEGGTVGDPMIDALVEIGPPSVPYILPYLEKFVAAGGVTSVGMFYALRGIGTRYRGDLGGIVDHVIIPKLEVIAEDEDNEFYDAGSVIDARNALADLQ